MKFFVIIVFATFHIAPFEACFSSGGGGGSSSSPSNAQQQQQQYQATNSLPPAVRVTTTPGAVSLYTNLPFNGDTCGHSRYWNSGELSLSNSAGIVGGVDAKPNEFPYQARLVFRRSTTAVCGATIISQTFVLTAAHCCKDFSAKDINVIVGDHNKSAIDAGELMIQPLEIIMHPNYNYGTQEYDFCLIRIEDGIVWNQKIQPVCLPNSCSEECKPINENGTADYVFITGWGAMSEVDSVTGKTPQILQKARVPVVNTPACAQSYTQIDQQITDNMICAGYVAGGIDSCQGDSGGPMVCYKHGYYQLDGITSFGNGCARKEYYGVYSRVCKVLSWLSTSIASPLTSTTTMTTTVEPSQETTSTAAGSDDYEVRVLGIMRGRTTTRGKGRTTAATTRMTRAATRNRRQAKATTTPGDF